MITIEILHGTSPQTRYVLDPPFTIGRSPSNGIVISDYHLSGEHVQIARLGAGTAIIARDLQSTNGSMLERGGNRIVLDAATKRMDYAGFPARRAAAALRLPTCRLTTG